MASKAMTCCPRCRLLASQIMRTLEEIEKNSADTRMTLEMKKKLAIEKLRRVIGSFATPWTSTPVGNFSAEDVVCRSDSHVSKFSSVEENTQIKEPHHENSAISLGAEEQEEKGASSSRALDKSKENFSLSSSGAEMENEEVEKNLLQLAIGSCVVVYCTICNKQFKEKSFARKHIQEVHLLNTNINEKLESEKEPQEMPVQNYVDSQSVSTSTLSPQENDAQNPPEQENEPTQKETEAEPEENIAFESVVMPVENQGIEIDNLPLVTRSKRSTRRGGGQILYQCLRDRSMKKNAKARKIHNIELSPKSTSTLVSVYQQQNQKKCEETMRKTPVRQSKAISLRNRTRSRESLEILEKTGEEINSSQEVEKTRHLNPSIISVPGTSASSSQSSASRKRKAKTSQSGEPQLDEIGITESFKNTQEDVEKAEKHLRLKETAGKKIWECSKCERRLASKSSALNHVLSIHYFKRVPCPKCSRPMASSATLKKHLPLCFGPTKKVVVNFPMRPIKGAKDKKALEYLTKILLYTPMRPQNDYKTLYDCTLCEEVYFWETKSKAQNHVKTKHFVCVQSPLSESDSNSNPGPSTSRISPVSSSEKMILRFDKKSLNRAMNARVVLKRLTSEELENSRKLKNNSNNNNNSDDSHTDEDESEQLMDEDIEKNTTVSSAADPNVNVSNTENGNETLEEEYQRQVLSVTLDLDKIRSELIFGKL